MRSPFNKVRSTQTEGHHVDFRVRAALFACSTHVDQDLGISPVR